MMRYLILQTSRAGYTAEQAEWDEHAMTVQELIDTLEEYDPDLKVYFSNDRGYTYGSVTEDCVSVETYEKDED